MFPHDCTELAEIIKQIEGAERIWSNKLARQYSNPMLIVDELSEADLERIDQVIARLHEDLNRANLQYEGGQSYISMALSYTYCKKNESGQTQKYAEDAKRQFGRSPSQWNQAIAHWFLGVVYRNNNLVGNAEAELKSALGILKSLASWAKQKLNYGDLEHCERQIDRIRQVMNELPSPTAQSPVINERRVSYEVFTKIIGLLEIPPDEFFHEWLEAIYSLEPSELPHIYQQIDILVSMLEQNPDEPMGVPLVNIFLAHCYTSGYFVAGDRETISLAVKYAEDAIAGFDSLTADYNQALTNWYLALIYRSIADTDKSMSRLYESSNLLQGLLEKYQDTDIYEELQSLQRDVQTWIEPTKAQNIWPPKLSQKQQIQKSKIDKKSSLSWFGTRQTSKPKSPQSTPFRKNESNVLQVKLSSQDGGKGITDKAGFPKESDSHILEKGRRQLQHIVIPVDIRALRELDVNSTRLDPELFKNLQSYGEKKEANFVQRPLSPDSKETTPHVKRMKIPSFPIYGQAAAGTKGEPNLDTTELENASIVYDDLCIDFNGKEYDVKFIENEEFNFLNWKRYGWLQVIGDSMNDCSPIHIKDGCYVLFAENRNIESCVMKIVVAVLPEPDTQPAQVVVKRLIKLSTQLPSRSDGFASEYSKFMLHSESSYENDPRTGMSYKKDVEVVKDNQVVGEVIAVASLPE